MQSKIAVITGAGSGIGLALTNELLFEYTQLLVIAFCRNKDKLLPIKNRYKDRLLIRQVDFNHNAAFASVKRFLENYQQVDYLVHCAGVVSPIVKLSSLNLDDWRKNHKVNLEMPLLITQLCITKFNRSRVLFLTSDHPITPVTGASAYCISKAGINTLTDCFRQEVTANIAVFTSVAPGNVDTPMQAEIRQASSDVLPLSDVLREMHDQNKLIPTALVAKYLKELLMSVSRTSFGTRSWNLLKDINESYHFTHISETREPIVQTDSALLLQRKMRGEVSTFGSAEYEKRRRVFNKAVSKYPMMVATPQSIHDIIEVIKFANKLSLLISIKGGGHGITGASIVDGGVVLDMANFQEISLSADGGHVSVGAGVKNKHLDHFLSRINKVVPLGTCPDVGVIGATLGGGIGFLSRKHGLSCDNVTRFDVIMADGKLLKVTPHQHPDLYWALRGCGGGQFGVVVSIEFALHPAPEFVEGGTIEWPISEAKNILKAYSHAVLEGPKSQFLYAYLAHSVPHKANISIMGFSESRSHGLKTVSSWREGATVSIERKQYIECQSNNYESGLGLYWQHGIIQGELTDKFIDILLACYQECPDDSGGIMLDPLCGAIQDKGANETAFIHRNASFICSITGLTKQNQDKELVAAWFKDTSTRLTPFFNGYAYQNYDMGEESAVIEYFGQHTEKLIAMKKRYDPNLRFVGSLQAHISPVL
jgi:NAD(P)-dependent dehydrogenase (short-subunit alcohol dehydrogenase family)/UDP-N-acetylenolpyruvoylglucosamine reductase